MKRFNALPGDMEDATEVLSKVQARIALMKL